MADGRPADLAGIHACLAAIEAGQVERLLLIAGRLNRRQQAVLDAAAQRNVPVQRADRTALLVAVPAGLRDQGVLGWRRAPAALPATEHTLDTVLAAHANPLLLVLDGVEDPRNLGACLRSADGAGAHAVVIPRGRGASVTAVVSRTAAGAAESLPVIVVPNLVAALSTLQARGVQIVGLADEAEAELYDGDLSGPLALVLGNEGQGLRRLTRSHCDRVLALPMRGSVSSLNVSVAAGVALYECQRQRRGRGDAL